jgi:formate hydrogenlyase subunit 3/multisubunit Na+/H+ antiporter MnhD subunit
LGIDIRLPIGFVFALVGILLTAFGAAGNRAIYERSLGVNVNLYWGMVLLAFGVIMAALGRRGMKKK